MRTAILTFALSFSVVACGPGTLKIGEGDPYDGMVDTDGDGIPDSPDSDGDGIPDSEDDEPDIPNDDEEEEEEESFPYPGEYDGGLSLEIWDMGDSYCDNDGAEFKVLENGELWGEGWCYNDYFRDEITLAYSGEVSDQGQISGTVAITLWLPTGGHGGWDLDTVMFDMEGSANGDELDIQFEGEVGGGNWGFDVDGESWGEK